MSLRQIWKKKKNTWIGDEGSWFGAHFSYPTHILYPLWALPRPTFPETCNWSCWTVDERVIFFASFIVPRCHIAHWNNLNFSATPHDYMRGELKVTAHSFVLLQLSSEIFVPPLEALWQLWPIEYACMHSQLLQLCPTLCDPMDCSPPGSSVHGILQARTLEWVAIHFSRRIFPIQGSNSCRLQFRRIFNWLSHQGSPLEYG